MACHRWGKASRVVSRLKNSPDVLSDQALRTFTRPPRMPWSSMRVPRCTLPHVWAAGGHRVTVPTRMHLAHKGNREYAVSCRDADWQPGGHHPACAGDATSRGHRRQRGYAQDRPAPEEV